MHPTRYWEIIWAAVIGGLGVCVTIVLRAFDHSLRHEGRLSVLEVSHRELVERLGRSEADAAEWRRRMDEMQGRQFGELRKISEAVAGIRGRDG